MTAEPFYADEAVTLHQGDCVEVLRTLPDASVDAVITDPPYGIGFMGHEWDQPGEYGAVTQNGTPGRFLSRAGRGHGAARVGTYDLSLTANRRYQAWCEAWATECLRILKPGGHFLSFGGARTYHRLAAATEDAGFEIRDSITWLFGEGFPKSRNLGRLVSDDWDGWGTALKPGHEPIVVGRKPLGAGSVAANVAEHGVGGLNIDGCRVEVLDLDYARNQSGDRGHAGSRGVDRRGDTDIGPGGGSASAGRWPANVVLDEDAAAALDRQSGVLTSGANPTRRGSDKFRDTYGDFTGQQECTPARGADVGGASRFFPTFRYEGKADTAERPRVNGVAHPTVKPLDLMRWLVRLVTPLGGLVLEPFAGSGTTAEACVVEGMRCIAIERNPDYLPLIVARLSKPGRADPRCGGARVSAPNTSTGPVLADANTDSDYPQRAAVDEPRRKGGEPGTTALARPADLDWKHHHVNLKPKPCRICRGEAFMTDETGTPCHKVCAERELVQDRRSA